MQGVTSLVVLPDGRLVSGSADKTIRVWNLVSGVCDRVLEGHTEVREANMMHKFLLELMILAVKLVVLVV